MAMWKITWQTNRNIARTTFLETAQEAARLANYLKSYPDFNKKVRMRPATVFDVIKAAR